MLQAITRGYMGNVWGQPISASPVAMFADRLLSGETDGFAIDATDASATPSYTGASYAGYVSVKDTTTPANNLSNVPLDSSTLAQSGTSPKLVPWNSSPYVRWTPHNLALQSQTLGDAAWSSTNITITSNDAVAPDGTTTAELVAHSGNGNVESTSSIAVVSGGVYTVSVYAKPKTTDWIRLLLAQEFAGTNTARVYFNVTTGTVGTSSTSGAGWSVVSSSITSAGNGWYRCTVTVSTGAATAFVFMRSANADNSNAVNGNQTWFWGAQLNRGPIATPYLVTTSAARIGIPQWYDTAAAKYGMLIEPAATNSITASQDFSVTSWPNENQQVLTANATTAPDGSTTATKFAATAANDVHAIGKSSITGGTFSIYAKAAEYSFLVIEASGVAATWFNLSTGALGTIGGGTPSITAVGNGWYRCVVVAALSAANLNLYVSNSDGVTSFAGDGASGIYIWGAQEETGGAPSSYIPTVGSTATRAKDIISLPMSTIPWSATQDTFYADHYPLSLFAAGGSGNVISPGAGTGSDMTLNHGGGDQPRFSVANGFVNQCDFFIGSYTVGVRRQGSFAAQANNFAASLDGGAPSTDVAGTMPNLSASTMYFGSDGSAAWWGVINRFVSVPRRVTDGDIPTWRYNF